MRKDILAKAVRLADKSKVRPEKIVVASPRQIAKKPAPEAMTERLYLRVTPTQHRQLLACLTKWAHVSDLLRSLVLDYLTAKTHERTRKKK